MNWHKVSSVTTGGKPFFYICKDKKRNISMEIVWQRGFKGWGVYDNIARGQLITVALTLPKAKKLAQDWLDNKLKAWV